MADEEKPEDAAVPDDSEEQAPADDSDLDADLAENEPQQAPDSTPAADAAEPAPAVPQQQQQEAQTNAPLLPVDQELKQEHTLTANDLANGHITPQTYGDLMSKSTFGRIGSLFGLILAGAGSGLTHQPNLLVEMMNKEIGNDLEAQKSSASNAQNLLRLNQQNELNKSTKAFQTAQIERYGKENELTAAETQRMKAEANIKAFALTRMQANLFALHDLTQKVNKYPEGSPDRQKAEQQLAILSNTIQNENFNIADRAAAASALANAAFTTNPEGGDEQAFQKQQGILRMSGNAPLADDRAERHFPGLSGLSSIPLSGVDREQINSGITFQNQLKRFTDWTKSHSGNLNPRQINEGQALAAQLQGAYRQATHGGVYKEGEQGFISSIIDSYPTKFFNKIRVLPQLKAIQTETAAQLDQFVKSKGFSGYKNSGPSQQVTANEKPEIKTMGGVKYQKVSGGWKRVKDSAVAGQK